MLNILTQASLSEADFNEQIDFVIEGFITKRMITMVYADGGNGKSWLAFALAKYCALRMSEVFYLDFDNPLSVLKDRNVNDLLIAQHTNLHYVQRSKCEVTSFELLQTLAESATANQFENMFFVIDSLRDFADVNNEAKIALVMNMLKDIREAGGTILILGHSNKDGRNYQGSNAIRNSVDNMYRLKKRELSGIDSVGVILEVKKERAAIVDKAFDITPTTLTLTEVDLIEAQSTEQDIAFIDLIKNTLLHDGKLNKTELLNKAGFAKDDKSARARLDKYDSIYWQSTKRHTRIIYQLIQSC
jgi:archaellum biogenesis ATPase FlaH